MRLRSGLKTSIWKVTKAMGMGEYELTRDEAGEAPTFQVCSCLYGLSQQTCHSLPGISLLSCS